MINLKNIVEGHINEFKSVVGLENKEDEKVFQSRAKVCRNCPLKSGNTCNPKMVISDDFTTQPFNMTMRKVIDKNHINGFYYLTKEGEKVYRGCGCRLSGKNRAPGSACPAGFWGGEFK